MRLFIVARTTLKDGTWFLSPSAILGTLQEKAREEAMVIFKEEFPSCYGYSKHEIGLQGVSEELLYQAQLLDMQLYSVTGLVHKDNVGVLQPIACIQRSVEAAMLKSLESFKREFIENRGWAGHTISLEEVSEELICKAFNPEFEV